MSHKEITGLIDELGEHAHAIQAAEPTCKADLYAELGLHLTYQPQCQTVRAEARLDPHRIGRRLVSEDLHEPIPNGC